MLDVDQDQHAFLAVLFDYAKAADVLAKADHAWLSRLITRRVPLANFADALKKQKGDIKVVIDFTL